MYEPAPAQRGVGDVDSLLAELTADVLLGDVCEPYDLPSRDRSLITVASLVTSGRVEQLAGHLKLAKDNGLTLAEVTESLVHLAFFVGWQPTMSAIQVARQVFAE